MTRDLRKFLREPDKGVKFNLKKCCFGKSEEKYIGHIFTNKGVKVDEDRVRSIVEMKEPRNKDELATFLGML